MINGIQPQPTQPLTPHEKLIQEFRSAVVGYDRWLADNRGQISPFEAEFHEMTIRFVKGLVKLARVRLAHYRQTHGALAQK